MTPYQALEAAKSGATYVSLFANRMLDSEILTLSGRPLEAILNLDWRSIVKEEKEKYFDKAWGIVTNKIAYVAEKLENVKSNLIIGSIRSPEDIYKICEAEPQIITIPTKIVKELKNILKLKDIKRSKFDYRGIIKGDSIEHPMTTYTLGEFEAAADKYRKN